MVEVRVEIMACSLCQELKGINTFFKIRTPWKRGISHDFCNRAVQIVVTQEEFEDHKRKRSSNTNALLDEVLLFLEVWSMENIEENCLIFNGDISINSGLEYSKLIGLAKANVSDQLQDQIFNPSIQWLKIYDPIKNLEKGKILLRIWTDNMNQETRNLVNESPENIKPDRGRRVPVLQKSVETEHPLPHSPPSPLAAKSSSKESSQSQSDNSNSSQDKDMETSPVSSRNSAAAVISNNNPSTSTSSVNSARSRRIAANIYGGFE